MVHLRKLLFIFLSTVALSLNEHFGEKITVGILQYQAKTIDVKACGSDVNVMFDNNKKIILKDGGSIRLKYKDGQISSCDGLFDNITFSKDKLAGLIRLSANGNSAHYRGSMSFVVKDKKVVPVNVIFAEEYLYGVVPCEISYFYHKEAIKAQAIAARTYLYRNIERHKYQYCDLVDNQDSQVYKGYDVEKKIFNDVINESCGQVIIYKSKLIDAYYFSNSGGYTADPKDVWGCAPIPYLTYKSDKDHWKGSSESYWDKKIDKKLISEKVGFRVNNVTVNKRKHGIALVVTLSGGRTKTMLADSFRSMLKLPSPAFELSSRGNFIYFKGRGSGHCVGMSQWGALTLAKRGYKAEDILKYYYKNVSVTHFSKVYLNIKKKSVGRRG